MRLGDLDALKEDLRRFFPTEVLEGIEPKTLFAQIMHDIDNAPTVEPFESDYVGAERLKARQRGYEEGYHNGMRIGKTLNPKIKQGEWIDYSDEGYVECPFCGSATNCEDNKDELHYCWNCGAFLH